MTRTGDFIREDTLQVLHAVGAHSEADDPLTTKHRLLCRINRPSASRLHELLPGFGKAGLPDWLHKRCPRGGDHGKRIYRIQTSRFT